MKDISIRKMAQDTSVSADKKFLLQNNTDQKIYYVINADDVKKEGYFDKGIEIEIPKNTKSATFTNDSYTLILDSKRLIEDFQKSSIESENSKTILLSSYYLDWKPNPRVVTQDLVEKLKSAPGKILNDAYGNKYKVISELSFEYIPKSGDKRIINSDTSFRSGYSWNNSAKALNALDSSASAQKSSETPETPTTAEAPATTATTPAAPAAPATPANTSKAIDGLRKILRMAESNSLKIDTKGFDFRSESKVWRGVIKGYGGASSAAEVCLRDAGFTQEELKSLSKVAELEDLEVSSEITTKSYLKKINDFFYKIKNTYSKRFLGTEEQIARAVRKGLSGSAGSVRTTSLAQLNLISKVAARRERAKKSLDSAIEKEASVEDDMTSKIERRRTAARAKLGL